jgi:hypothetical protein
MNLQDDPFVAAATFDEDGGFSTLAGRSALQHAKAPTPSPFGVTVARFHGFDALEQPLVVYGIGGVDHVLPACATVKLCEGMKGVSVLVAYENADLEKPVVIGVIEASPRPARGPGAAIAQAQVDDERRVIEAEREVVLRCGNASITLTRAGKVLIQGTYVLSRSTGYNKLKGAAIELN